MGPIPLLMGFELLLAIALLLIPIHRSEATGLKAADKFTWVHLTESELKQWLVLQTMISMS